MKSFALLTLLFSGVVFSANAQFITIWDTTVPGITGNNQISISRANAGFFSGFFVKVDDPFVNGTISETSLSPTITFPQPGQYRVTLNTNFTSIMMGGNGDGNKLLSVEAWGNAVWTTMDNAFSGCESVVVNASDSPNLSAVTSMRQMFEVAFSVTGAGFENWNVGNVQDFTNTFALATTFNGAIGTWDMHSAKNLTSMFAAATSFDQDISGWNVSNVTNMQAMFRASVFNHNINNWNVGNVTNMIAMFSRTEVFNQPLNNWNVSNVTDLDQMFAESKAFNQNINNWNVSNCNNFAEMFNAAQAFNQPLNAWNMSACAFAAGMFQDAAVFNQPLNNWDLGLNTSFDRMFDGATQFNQDISGWDLHSAFSTNNMFHNAVSFDQDLSLWNTSTVVSMSGMFMGAVSFNSNIGNWDVHAVTDMSYGFDGATIFNQDITNWDVSAVTSMTSMFHGASAFNQNLATWDISQVGDMSDIFHNSGLTDDNYDNALIGWAALSSVSADITVGAQTNNYCKGKAAHTFLSGSRGWIFFDGGEFCSPIITSFTPTAGTTGTTVVITGSRFTGANSVSFGDVDADEFTVDDDNTISAVVDNGATGTVAVTTPDGTGTLNGFVYFEPTDPTSGAVIAVKEGDNNTGNPIGSTAIDIGSTSQGKALEKKFSIVNTGSAAASIVSIDSSDPAFRIVDPAPSIIEPNSFEILTISLNNDTPGNYSATITVTFTDDTFSFSIEGEVGSDDLVVYNAVTPNGDDAHDWLKIKNIENYPGNKVVILDRLGNEVYSISDYDNANPSKRFDGVSNKGAGRNLTDGTYFYVISANNKKYTGFLLLQR
jgi:gliding motility-associated-like protein